jgi:hypothetical protein
MLAIASPTSGGRSVGIVRSRTQTMELSYTLQQKVGHTLLFHTHNNFLLTSIWQYDKHHHPLLLLLSFFSSDFLFLFSCSSDPFVLVLLFFRCCNSSLILIFFVYLILLFLFFSFCSIPLLLFHAQFFVLLSFFCSYSSPFLFCSSFCSSSVHAIVNDEPWYLLQLFSNGFNLRLSSTDSKAHDFQIFFQASSESLLVYIELVSPNISKVWFGAQVWHILSSSLDSDCEIVSAYGLFT